MKKEYAKYILDTLRASKKALSLVECLNVYDTFVYVMIGWLVNGFRCMLVYIMDVPANACTYKCKCIQMYVQIWF